MFGYLFPYHFCSLHTRLLNIFWNSQVCAMPVWFCSNSFCILKSYLFFTIQLRVTFSGYPRLIISLTIQYYSSRNFELPQYLVLTYLFFPTFFFFLLSSQLDYDLFQSRAVSCSASHRCGLAVWTSVSSATESHMKRGHMADQRRVTGCRVWPALESQRCCLQPPWALVSSFVKWVWE